VVVVSAATAIAIGTYIGGWRIIRTPGHRIGQLAGVIVHRLLRKSDALRKPLT
jgi:hypothetical protein